MTRASPAPAARPPHQVHDDDDNDEEKELARGQTKGAQ